MFTICLYLRQNERDRSDLDQSDARVAVAVAMFIMHALCMQAVEALVHINAMSARPVVDADVVGAAGYVTVALQPAHLCLIAAFALGGPATGGFGAVLCTVTAVVVGVHVLVCLMLDGPLERWMRIGMVKTGWGHNNLLYHFFSPREASSTDATLYGSVSRWVVYFAAVAIAGTVLAFEALDMANAAEPWTQRIGVAILVFEASALVLLAISHCVSRDARVGSVWCMSVLLAALCFGAVLGSGEAAWVVPAWAAAHVVGWVSVLGVTDLVTSVEDSKVGGEK